VGRILSRCRRALDDYVLEQTLSAALRAGDRAAVDVLRAEARSPFRRPVRAWPRADEPRTRRRLGVAGAPLEIASRRRGLEGRLSPESVRLTVPFEGRIKSR
jgi:hypothetical protein